VYLRRLANLAMGKSDAPDDCQTIAYAELSGLKSKLEKLLDGDSALDSYTRAHFAETSDRIEKVLDANLTLTAP
jgi:hypothetical protein